MDYPSSTFLAFLFNAFGVCVYCTSPFACEPLVSSLLFLIGVFVLICKINIYPARFRKLWGCAARIVQFLVSAFLMEHIMIDFWFPLEASLFKFLPKISCIDKKFMYLTGYRIPFLHYLNREITHVLASYLLALFLLLCCLHVTRMVDLRLIRESGFRSFFKHALGRWINSLKKLLKGDDCECDGGRRRNSRAGR